MGVLDCKPAGSDRFRLQKRSWLQLIPPPVRKVPLAPFWYQYQAALDVPSPVQPIFQSYGVSAKTVGTIDRAITMTGEYRYRKPSHLSKLHVLVSFTSLG